MAETTSKSVHPISATMLTIIVVLIHAKFAPYCSVHEGALSMSTAFASPIGSAALAELSIAKGSTIVKGGNRKAENRPTDNNSER